MRVRWGFAMVEKSKPNETLRRKEFYWAKEKEEGNSEWRPIYLDRNGLWWPSDGLGWYDDIDIYIEYIILPEIIERPKD